MKYEPRTKPFKHQAKATLLVARRFIRGGKGFALFMEPRTGKSKAALDAVGILRLRGEVERVAILCPKVALEVWDTQIRKHYPYRAECEDHQYTWVRNTHHSRPELTTRFYLLGYEKSARRIRKRSKWIRPYLNEVEAWGADLLILDESHRLKRAGGVTAQGLWRMVARLRRKGHTSRPFVVLLTGTPTPKGKIDLFAQFRVMDESIFGTSKAGFEDEHVVYGKGPKTKFKIMRYRNEQRLDRLTRAHSFSISQEAAGLAKQQFTQNLTVQLPPAIKGQYDELAEFYITQIKGETIEGKNSGAVRTRLLQVTGGFTTDGVQLHGAKTGLFRDYTRVVAEQGEPLLVYCRFLSEVSACVEILRELGFMALPFTGKERDRDRRRALLGLKRKNGAVVFQAQAGSVALDLSTVAEVVFFSLPDGWESYWGDRNRVLGPAQRRPVRYTHLIARNTIDRSVLRNLQKKEDLHATMMRNPRRYLTGL